VAQIPQLPGACSECIFGPHMRRESKRDSLVRLLSRLIRRSKMRYVSRNNTNTPDINKDLRLLRLAGAPRKHEPSEVVFAEASKVLEETLKALKAQVSK
jgi:hypothetical protein